MRRETWVSEWVGSGGTQWQKGSSSLSYERTRARVIGVLRYAARCVRFPLTRSLQQKPRAFGRQNVLR